jgi:dihydrofolate reductase|uniref:dihydrofolate reductase n=1 Tax=Halomonas sp. TaxID=1486246 RepID=UPI00261245E1|nr:dihydrofolate reductase [Halomonas sp.]
MSRDLKELDTFVPVAMIAAMSRNRIIGVDNQLPWYLPEDLKFFKRMTQAKPLVMGRKTYESIGRPLPNRLNIVVTRDESFEHPGVRVCHDLASAIELADHQAILDGAEEIMIMGGAQIYAQAMSIASRLYITEVELDIEGDASFPEIEPDVWHEVESHAGSPTAGQPNYRFVQYQRNEER